VCPDGKLLTLQAKKVVIDGVIYRRYVADTKYCKGCQVKLRCISRKNAKRRVRNVPVVSVPGNLTKEMAEKIDTVKGRHDKSDSAS
jgi:hypothetical protein